MLFLNNESSRRDANKVARNHRTRMVVGVLIDTTMDLIEISLFSDWPTFVERFSHYRRWLVLQLRHRFGTKFTDVFFESSRDLILELIRHRKGPFILCSSYIAITQRYSSLIPCNLITNNQKLDHKNIFSFFLRLEFFYSFYNTYSFNQRLILTALR